MVDPQDIARLITENPDVPAAGSPDLLQKVAEWNKAYRVLSSEMRLKDLSPAVYEDLVVAEILDICGGNVGLAIEVLEHEDCDGGWMMGDAIGKLAAKTENPDVPAEPNTQQSALKLLHLSDWNDTDKYYEVPASILMSFKDKIEQVGISAAWRWFTDLVDYSTDASDQNKPVKRIDDSNNTLDNYFLGWLNPMESIAEWDL